ncbi:hypothetical protein H0H87_005257 [Tephrocybe sp. NHM501043]|nr:hypothetical protein H0H87_005257 [Tephrocybe sp. NHM501043]
MFSDATTTAHVAIIGFEKTKLLPESLSSLSTLALDGPSKSAPDDGPIPPIPSWQQVSTKKEHKKLDTLLMTQAELLNEKKKHRIISENASAAISFATNTNHRARESRREPRKKLYPNTKGHRLRTRSA